MHRVQGQAARGAMKGGGGVLLMAGGLGIGVVLGNARRETERKD
jgi:hypothetical protein